MNRTSGRKRSGSRGPGIDYVNHIAYMNGHHKHMFDEESLLFLLHDCGFREVRARAFDKDSDRKERDLSSLYAEARK